MKKNIEYGFWPSSITAEQLSSASVRYAEPKIDQDTIYWLESRPSEQGRSVLVQYKNGRARDLLSNEFNLRTRAQEYGGACYAIGQQQIFFVNDFDQAIYLADLQTQTYQRLSPEGNFRYADLWLDRQHNRLLVIRETYSKNITHPVTDIIALDLESGQITSLISGQDFYSNPRVSPCGTQLSFLTWNHPSMPWDSSYCVVCSLDVNGIPTSQTIVAGGEDESVFQPQWTADNQLIFVSDKSNWWNLYLWNGKSCNTIYPMDAEFATPQWVFGMSSYGFLDNNHLLCSYTQQGQWHLATINWREKTLQKIETDCCDIGNMVCSNSQAVWIGATTYKTSSIYHWQNNSIDVLTKNSQAINSQDISKAVAIEFPTANQQQAYGFFYPPTNSQIESDPNRAPPVIVICHGGPTGACETGLNLKIQFWTNRGFAVVDVNYRGSTGYGRQFRDSLNYQWGIADVEDVCAAVDYLVEKGWASNNIKIIRGSSAGGFTVLAALTFSNHFSLGCSLYGIGDLEALAKDTHKFETHYLDGLVGAYPEMQNIYRQRSPIRHIEKLNCPVIIFQGLQDKVVPPNQAEAMVEALKQKNIPVDYVTFADEGHGFRQAGTIKTLYDKELAFYQKFLAQNKE
jgi:dipeptidyl aminopeptidase/acylaminoacyl peptidase